MTQAQTIKKHLEQHGSITTIEAVQLYYIVDLQGVIRDLKNSGINIKGIWSKSSLGKRYKKYFLSKKLLDSNQNII